MKFLTRGQRSTDDLSAALHTISEFNRIIAAADTKVGFLLTANGFALAGMVTGTRIPANLVVRGTSVALEVVLLVCMGFLAATLHPNLRNGSVRSWFSFPGFPVDTTDRPAVPALADQAWSQAATLAEIAQRKYRRLKLALRWSALSLILFSFWFTLLLFSPGPA